MFEKAKESTVKMLMKQSLIDRLIKKNGFTLIGINQFDKLAVFIFSTNDGQPHVYCQKVELSHPYLDILVKTVGKTYNAKVRKIKDLEAQEKWKDWPYGREEEE